MRAVVCDKFCDPMELDIREIDELSAQPGQVIISGRAWGINLPDSLVIAGKYQVEPAMPFSPGIELAGVVESVGDGVDGIDAGMRVAAHTLFGALAEQVSVPAHRVFPIPDSVDFVQAAGFLVNYGTSYNALKVRGQLQPGETLVVLGAGGGVGVAAVDLGVALGARVIAVASTAQKLDVCRQHGAHHLIDYSKVDLRSAIRALVGPAGVDVVFDPVGGVHANPMVRSLAFNGRYLVVGFASGTIPSIPLNLPLLKTTSLVGVHWGAWVDARPVSNAADIDELLGLLARGTLRPHISTTYPFEQAREAMALVAARQSVGKVVVTHEEAAADCTQSSDALCPAATTEGQAP